MQTVKILNTRVTADGVVYDVQTELGKASVTVPLKVAQKEIVNATAVAFGQPKPFADSETNGFVNLAPLESAVADLGGTQGGMLQRIADLESAVAALKPA